MIILRQRAFSEDEKKGMSTSAKVALGTAATAALTFAGARRGMLGGKAQVATNTMWGNMGKTLGSQGMMNSAAKGIGSGTAVQAVGAGATAKNATMAGQFAQQQALGTWTGGTRIGYKDAISKTSQLASSVASNNIVKY